MKIKHYYEIDGIDKEIYATWWKMLETNPSDRQ
jgi:hypothetical protein